MGFGRWIWRRTLIGETIDTVRNIRKERSFFKGIKRTFKEEICEDNPLTSAIYRAGKFDGKKQGYIDASQTYEKKLLSQADEFLSQKKNLESSIKEYELLLDEYEKEIDRLSNIKSPTKKEKGFLEQLKIRVQKLRNLK